MFTIMTSISSNTNIKASIHFFAIHSGFWILLFIAIKFHIDMPVFCLELLNVSDWPHCCSIVLKSLWMDEFQVLFNFFKVILHLLITELIWNNFSVVKVPRAWEEILDCSFKIFIAWYRKIILLDKISVSWNMRMEMKQSPQNQYTWGDSSKFSYSPSLLSQTLFYLFKFPLYAKPSNNFHTTINKNKSA